MIATAYLSQVQAGQGSGWAGLRQGRTQAGQGSGRAGFRIALGALAMCAQVFTQELAEVTGREVGALEPKAAPKAEAAASAASAAADQNETIEQQK